MSGMQEKYSRECPKCSRDSKVVDSRMDASGFIWRRRECIACGHRWKTYEVNQEFYEELERRKSMLDQKSYIKKSDVIARIAKALNM